MASILALGLGITGAALVGRAALKALGKTAPPKPTWMPPGKWAKGGFQSTMTTKEAALILGVRESTPNDKLKQAHRKVMLQNHPDRGGSPYIASKINEAKDLLDNKR